MLSKIANYFTKKNMALAEHQRELKTYRVVAGGIGYVSEFHIQAFSEDDAMRQIHGSVFNIEEV